MSEEVHINTKHPLRVPHGDASGTFYNFVAARVDGDLILLFESCDFAGEITKDAVLGFKRDNAPFSLTPSEWDRYDGDTWASGNKPRGFAWDISSEQSMRNAADEFLYQKVWHLRDIIKSSVDFEARTVSIEYFRADEEDIDEDGDDMGRMDSVECSAAITFDAEGRATYQRND